MSIKGPQFGTIGMPPGERPRRYPDMESDKLTAAIEAEGVRFAWSRAADCPCVPINTQTKQPDPNCPLCRGTSVLYFGPQNYSPPHDVGNLTAIQKAILAVDGAAVIKGVVAKVTSEQDLYDVLGRWVWGAMMISVRPENKLGYYDRLVNLDAEMVYFQTITAKANTATFPLRYLATAVNLARTDSTIYTVGHDFTIEAGIPKWLPSRIPGADLNLSVHYHMHPTWIVMDHPHVFRETTRRLKGAELTPLGSPTALPIQGHIRLEFLPPSQGV